MKHEAELKDYLELHKRIVVADGHCDTLLHIANGTRTLGEFSKTGHVDLVRLQEGGVGIQFFAAFVETAHKPFNALTRALQLIETFHTETEFNGHFVEMGLTAGQIKKALKTDKIIGILGIEGGEALNGSLEVLRIFFRLGVRFIGLTWNHRNQIADGAWESGTKGGLTSFGRRAVEEMNRLGIIVDLAHISEAGFWDVLELSKDPVMVSHANCQAIFQHPRNLTDAQIQALAQKNGLFCLSFVPAFMGPGETSLTDFLDQVDYVASVAGTNVIGIGSDFDGIDSTPAGLEDCRCFPYITQGLWQRGYTEKEISNIMGGNLLRLLENVIK